MCDFSQAFIAVDPSHADIEWRLIIVKVAVAGGVVGIQTPTAATCPEGCELDHDRSSALDCDPFIDISPIGNMNRYSFAIVTHKVDPPAVILVSNSRVCQMHGVTLPFFP